VPGPHEICLGNPAVSRTIVPACAYFQTELSPFQGYPDPGRVLAREVLHRVSVSSGAC
jgi:hypothetical protein